MPSVCLSVPIFTKRESHTFARSGISSGAVAIIGLAPQARVTLADCVAATTLVIWTPGVKIGDNSGDAEKGRLPGAQEACAIEQSLEEMLSDR